MAKPKAGATGLSFSDAIENTLPNMDEFDSAFSNSKTQDKIPGTKLVTVEDPQNIYNVPFEMLEYDFFHEVYVIYRPWTQCRRCMTGLDISTIPDDEDLVCPHQRRNDYVKLMQKFLSEGYIRQSLREETLVDGSIQVSLAWLVPKVNAKKMAELKKKSMEHTSEDSE